MEKTEIREKLTEIEQGARIRVELEDGTYAIGAFEGVSDGQVHIEGNDDVALDQVETFLMDVSTDGEE